MFKVLFQKQQLKIYIVSLNIMIIIELMKSIIFKILFEISKHFFIQKFLVFITK